MLIIQLVKVFFTLDGMNLNIDNFKTNIFIRR